MSPDRKARVVKRYRNRKLYDTTNSCYVTLEDVGNYIKSGEDVVVIDNRTQEDLTSVTLTQIIFEQEKKKKNLLPLTALKNIIQSGGEHLASFLQKSIQNVPLISDVKDEAERVIDKIRDEIGDGSAFIREFITKTHHSIDDLSKKLEDKLKPIGRITNLPFLRAEVRSILKKVAELERKLHHLDKK